MPLGTLTAVTGSGTLTAAVAPYGALTASSMPGTAILGLLDETATPILDEGSGFILLEDGT